VYFIGRMQDEITISDTINLSVMFGITLTDQNVINKRMKAIIKFGTCLLQYSSK
jgi:hypothetical protein